MASDVSIVIPNLNSPLIEDVVNSVWLQIPNGLSAEVIVCGLDDLGLVERTKARYVSIGRPLSIPEARNLGVRESTGKQIIFLDADCIPEPGWFETLMSHPWDERVAVSGAIRVQADRFFRVAGNVASFHDFTTALPISERQFLASFSLALPRQSFDEIGWFDESLERGEDLDFTIRLSQAGYRLRFDPSAAVVHRPSRVTFRSVLFHAYQSGACSIRVRCRYPDVFGMPRWLLHWPLLLACSPLLAIAVTTRALHRNRDVRAHWPVLPLMVLSRLTWCLGACDALRGGSNHPHFAHPGH